MNYMELPWDLERLQDEARALLPALQVNSEAFNDHYEACCSRQGTSFVVAKRWAPSELVGCDKLRAILCDHGVWGDVGHAQLFVCRPRVLGLFHLDGVDRHASINVPIYNASEGVVEWTDEEIEATLERTPYTAHWVPNKSCSNARITDASVLKQAQLLRTDVWHRLNNRGNACYRVVFSVRFKSNPTFDELATLFKERLA